MAKRTITSAQKRALDTQYLDLMGGDANDFTPVKFDNLGQATEYLGAVYQKKLVDQLAAKDASSSGNLADKTIALDLVILGSVYSVSIQTTRYAKFLDEGVSGWAKDRGSQYKFKTKGVAKDGDLLKSIKAYLIREGKIGRLTKNVQVSDRERKRAKITDATTSAAITAAYMIKRQGIAPTHFWRDATRQMDAVVKAEFSAALKIDIIENLTGKK